MSSMARETSKLSIAYSYCVITKVLDVNFLLRKAATASTPVMEVTEDGGNWTIKTSTTLKNMELKFKVSLCSFVTLTDLVHNYIVYTCINCIIYSQAYKKSSRSFQTFIYAVP